MKSFVIFAIVVTIIYVIYYTVIIVQDLYGKPKDEKSQGESFDVSDMTDEEESIAVSESDGGFSVGDNQYETAYEEKQLAEPTEEAAATAEERVISDYELSLARNQLAVACAELEQAKAQESDARNNLSYTEIKSPSNGVVGTLPYRIGALVGPNMAQPFTVVSDNAEMYAYFSISENMLRRYSARYGSIDSMIAGTPEVGLQLNDGSLYKAKGRIETVSGVVDPVTGTVQIKALFPNPDRELLSGSIGNVILQNPKTEAVTIPMTATVELQDKIIAYRLKNGQAEAAYLTVDRLNDGNRFIVKEGLSVGDTIVAEGVGLVREGMSITPKNETK